METLLPEFAKYGFGGLMALVVVTVMWFVLKRYFDSAQKDVDWSKKQIEAMLMQNRNISEQARVAREQITAAHQKTIERLQAKHEQSVERMQLNFVGAMAKLTGAVDGVKEEMKTLRERFGDVTPRGGGPK
mgnify:CR=1 FL=1